MFLSHASVKTISFVLYLLFYVNTVSSPKVLQFDGLVQERPNSIAKALELSLSCTK